MTQQYLRQVSLIVGDDSGAAGEALQLGDMHIQFVVHNTTAQTLKRAEITIWNLNQETTQRFKNEFTRIELQAGYEGNLGLLFQGQIAHLQAGRQNGTDAYVSLVAQDNDEAFNFAITNQTLAKGWTPDDMYNALLQDMQPYGVTGGYKPTFNGNAAPRGSACYGMTRDYLRTLAQQQNCEWHIEDGKLNFVPLDSFIPGDAVVINSQTGMIGTPHMEIEGLFVRTLLNPNIKSGGQVKIDQASIASLQVKFALSGLDVAPGTDKDGMYTSRVVTHTGDTRGQPWYTDCICVAVDGTAPASGPTIVDVPGG